MDDKEEEDKEKCITIEDAEDIDIPNKSLLKKKPFIILIIIMILILLIITIIILIILLKIPEKKDEEEIIDEWTESYQKAQHFLNKLNLTEKISLLFGTQNYESPSKEEELRKTCVGKIDPFNNSEIEFKGMCLQDGPAGIRFANGTSISWQSSLNTASTFNKNLMYEIGKAQGEESKLKGINTFLSPSVNIIRSPQSGRIWETFGEDPYLSGIAASQIIKGIQDNGVIATVKHFVGNEQETYRRASSSNIEPRALMDVFVEPFYRAVKAGVGAVMTAYNAVNNTYAFENKFLITDVLRNILGFRGFVVSDWWGVVSNNTQCFNSGLDMSMPGGKYWGKEYVGRDKSFWSNFEQYVKEGKITEKRINEAASHIIATMYKLNQTDNDNIPDVDLYKETNTDERKKLQRIAATESQILLKNDGILPLKNVKKIAVIGNDAFPRDCDKKGDSDLQCLNDTNKVMNGHTPLGYGSGTTTFEYLITPIKGILNIAKEKQIEVVSSGNLMYLDEDINGTYVHIDAKEDIDSAIKIANESEIAIIFVNAISGEEYLNVEKTIGDRLNLNLLHYADELIEEVSKINNNTIVVINSPGVVNMPWINKVRAIIFSGFPGAESGNAIADILFGNANPSGHLPYVWGNIDDYPGRIYNLENLTIVEGTNKTWKDIYRYEGVDSAGLIDDLPGHDPEQVFYKEGLYIGQRWFNKNNIKPIFPFGFGLSYTKFEYNDLKVTMSKEGLNATFNVVNKGDIAGKAVPMMFLTFPDYIGDYPKYILKGFEKVEVNPGETKIVSIIADEHALSYFDVTENNYTRVNKDKIKVSIGENGDPNQTILNAEIDASYTL